MTVTISDEDSVLSPIYRSLSQFKNVGAAYTGKGTSPSNSCFSFQRPSASSSPGFLNIFTSNLTDLAKREAFDPAQLIWPNGAWPHSGQAIKIEDYTLIRDLRTGGFKPVTGSNQPVTYDGIATASDKYVLAVQGADCPSIFLYDPTARITGLAHAGWKPVVRGVIQNTLEAMQQLGAKPDNVLAYISPAAGDRYNQFLWDDRMESHIRDVFIEADRQDLLGNEAIRYEMNGQDRADLASALGRAVQNGTSFKLSEFAATELERYGVPPRNITRSFDSTIVNRNSSVRGIEYASFRYHSFRRERPKHGLGMSVLFLRTEREAKVE